MRIGILGAGFAGLSAAYELNKKGYEVWIFEKGAQSGGAAGGFKRKNWDWYLDYAYHHWFTNDYEILNLTKKIGFNQVIVRRPETASLYEASNSQYLTSNKDNELFKKLLGEHNQVCKLDSPLDLLKFERLSLIDRLRTGFVLAGLKLGPKLPLYDTVTAYNFLERSMGRNAHETLWKPLFSKKFGRFAPEISMSFFWARINKRTSALAYPEGGFQAFANFFADFLIKKGVKITYKTEVKQVEREKEQYIVKTAGETYNFDSLMNTLPSPLFLKLQKNVISEQYAARLANIHYIGAQEVILETKNPVLDKTYWLNITTLDNPWMVAVQHTNFMDKKHFGNNHVLYLAVYTEKKLTSITYPLKHTDIVWQTEAFIPLAQPLYTTEFARYMPHFKTPTPGLYFANMEMTYPYDRGTNYAVEVGRKAAELI